MTCHMQIIVGLLGCFVCYRGLLQTEDLTKKHPNNLHPELHFVRWILSEPPSFKFSIGHKLSCSKIPIVYLRLNKSIYLTKKGTVREREGGNLVLQRNYREIPIGSVSCPFKWPGSSMLPWSFWSWVLLGTLGLMWILYWIQSVLGGAVSELCLSGKKVWF